MATEKNSWETIVEDKKNQYLIQTTRKEGIQGEPGLYVTGLWRKSPMESSYEEPPILEQEARRKEDAKRDHAYAAQIALDMVKDSKKGREVP